MNVIIPDWPAPSHVCAFSTTRQGGVSLSPYGSLNLGDYVGDDESCVLQNRRRIQEQQCLSLSPIWLKQTHGVAVHQITRLMPSPVEADASYCDKRNLTCVVMTADCLPLLVCDRAGTQVAAIHAGWRGLCAGIIEKTILEMGLPADQLLVWLGPAIGSQAFEVGDDVREAFLVQSVLANTAFVQHKKYHWLADIYLLARQRLTALGISAIYGGEFCTYQQDELFFSYRRDGVTGRMASFISLS